jgi:hypothetical protein
LEVVTDPAMQEMTDHCKPAAGAGYTAAQYAIAVEALMASPYSAVRRDELEPQLGGTANENQAALQAMVRANVLGVRPFSYWARDIDPKAFGSTAAMVVTAPSSVHRYLMKSEEFLTVLRKAQKVR